MIQEDYCSYEVAKLLKEKGFEGICDYAYSNKGNYFEIDRSNFDEVYCLRPTLQMAMKWLRKKHKIMITIIPQEVSVGVDRICYAIYRITEDLYQPLCNGKVDNIVDSYEETVEVAIKYSLENLI